MPLTWLKMLVDFKCFVHIKTQDKISHKKFVVVIFKCLLCLHSNFFIVSYSWIGKAKAAYNIWLTLVGLIIRKLK